MRPRKFKQHFLRAWRHCRNLSQPVLAEKAGLTHGTISQLENGIIGYTQETIEELAVVLGCSPADIIGNPPGIMQEIISTLRLASEQELIKILVVVQAIISRGNDIIR